MHRALGISSFAADATEWLIICKSKSFLKTKRGLFAESSLFCK